MGTKRKSCKGKVKHPDMRTAKRAAVIFSEKTGIIYSPYQCKFGPHYHIGTAIIQKESRR